MLKFLVEYLGDICDCEDPEQIKFCATVYASSKSSFSPDVIFSDATKARDKRLESSLSRKSFTATDHEIDANRLSVDVQLEKKISHEFEQVVIIYV